MSSSALKKIPPWIWWSLCPVFGALTIAYAGYLTKTNRWMQTGIGMSAVVLLASIDWSIMAGISGNPSSIGDRHEY